MKRTMLFPVLFAMLAGLAFADSGSSDATEAQRAKVDALLARMTIEEKIGQLNLSTGGDIVTGIAMKPTSLSVAIRAGQVGGVFNVRSVDRIREIQRLAVEESRLGIPLLFGMDVIHGYETEFPIPLGLSCSWDPDLVEETARVAAREATTEGISWTYSPMVDISRDPRWGRVAEGNGEDPYLGSLLANAMVKGYQGNRLDDADTMMACVKHFALYGAAEAGRDYNGVDMSEQRMRNVYFPPYRAAVEAGVGSVMTSFNEINGVPASADAWLLTNVLRREWGFDGLVVSDYTAINELVDHGIGNLHTVSVRALNAGLDMDMASSAYSRYIRPALAAGEVSADRVDEACRRVLMAKARLGLLDDPYKYCQPELAKKEVFSEEHRAFARAVAPQTFVLLKNADGLLPLKKTGTIAVVGPLADNRENMLGTWAVAARTDKAISLLDGVSAAVGKDARVLYAKGANVVATADMNARIDLFGKSTRWDARPADDLIKEAVKMAKRADVIVAALGESAEMSGESSSRSDIGLPANQRALLDALAATGKPVALVLFAGRPLTLEWEAERIPAILDVWFPGSEAGAAIADTLFGDANPSGKLTMTFPRSVGQIPIYYGHKNTGRPLSEKPGFQKFKSNYLDISNEPLFPFGYGLSYTTFRYGPLKLSADSLRGDATLTASIDVTNTGSRVGRETVQLYIRDMVGSVTRPVQELKGFRKIELKPGETQTVSFEITTADLEFYNAALEKVWEPGTFEIMIGASSRDVKSGTVEWER